MQGWILPPNLPEDRKARFSRVFGKLVLRYTPTRVFSEFDTLRDVEQYTVLGRDADSVAIFSWHDDPRSGAITHIHFEGDRYWATTGVAKNVEYFRKVSTSRARSRRAVATRPARAAAGRRRPRTAKRRRGG